jgi:hypothetical protein
LDTTGSALLGRRAFQAIPTANKPAKAAAPVPAIAIFLNISFSDFKLDVSPEVFFNFARGQPIANDKTPVRATVDKIVASGSDRLSFMMVFPKELIGLETSLVPNECTEQKH